MTDITFQQFLEELKQCPHLRHKVGWRSDGYRLTNVECRDCGTGGVVEDMDMNLTHMTVRNPQNIKWLK